MSWAAHRCRRQRLGRSFLCQRERASLQSLQSKSVTQSPARTELSGGGAQGRGRRLYLRQKLRLPAPPLLVSCLLCFEGGGRGGESLSLPLSLSHGTASTTSFGLMSPLLKRDGDAGGTHTVSHTQKVEEGGWEVERARARAQWGWEMGGKRCAR